MSIAAIQNAIDIASAGDVVCFHNSRPMQAATPYVFDERLRLKGTSSTSGIEYRGDTATYDSLDGHVTNAGTVIMKDPGTCENPQHDHYAFDLPAGGGGIRDNITIHNLTFDGCGIAVLNGSATNLVITNNLCRNALGDPDSGDATHTPAFNGIINATTGLSADSPLYTQLSNNVFKDNEVWGIYFDDNGVFNRVKIENNVFSNCNGGLHLKLGGSTGDNHDDIISGNVGTLLSNKLIEVVGDTVTGLVVSGNRVSGFRDHTDDTMGLSIAIKGPNVRGMQIYGNEISDIPGVGTPNEDDHHAAVRIGIEAGGPTGTAAGVNPAYGTLIHDNLIYGTFRPISIVGAGPLDNEQNRYAQVYDNTIVYVTGRSVDGVDSKGVVSDNGSNIIETNQGNAVFVLPNGVGTSSVPITVAFDAWVTGTENGDTIDVGSDGTITRNGSTAGHVPDTSSISGLGPGRAIVYGFGGNDTITADTSTANPSVLSRYAFAGGYGAGDTTGGSDGTDTLTGGAGTDTLFGGSSPDVLKINMIQGAHFPGKAITVGHAVNVSGDPGWDGQHRFELVATAGDDTLTFTAADEEHDPPIPAKATITKIDGVTLAACVISQYGIESVNFDGKGGTVQHGDSLTIADDVVVKVLGDEDLEILNLNTTGTLDMDTFDLALRDGSGWDYADVTGKIVSARNGGAWNGTGITSSAAKDQANHATTLGTLTGSEFLGVGGTTHAGHAVASGDVLVKYTYYGDTDFNGVVNFDDYVRTDNGYNNHLTGWRNGDFDGNGAVNFDDYVLIDLAFNSQGGALRPGEGGSTAWEEIAQMDHFQNEGYEAYLIDALADLGITVTHEDFLP